MKTFKLPNLLSVVKEITKRSRKTKISFSSIKQLHKITKFWNNARIFTQSFTQKSFTQILNCRKKTKCCGIYGLLIEFCKPKYELLKHYLSQLYNSILFPGENSTLHEFNHHDSQKWPITTLLKKYRQVYLSLVVSLIFLVCIFGGKAQLCIDSPDTMRKLCISTKFPHQEIRWNYSIFAVFRQQL